MNRAFIEIKLIFFLILLCFAPALLPGAVQIEPGLTLRTDVSGFDADFLKDITRQLDRYARSAKLKSSGSSIEIIANAKGDLRFSGRFLYIPGDAGHWQGNFVLRRKIYGALAAHRFNYRYPAGSNGVAPWIANALDSELLAAETSGQYLFSNRSYPLITEFAARHDALPDFRTMSQLEYPNKDQALNDLGAEQGRLLLLITASTRKISDLFAQSCAGGEPDLFVSWFSSPQQSQELLSQAAEVFLWNRMHPLPADAAIRKLPELLKVMVAGVNDAGVADGNFKEYSWEEFFLLLENAPETLDKKPLIENYTSRFQLFRKTLTVEESRIVSGLIAAINLAGKPEAKDKFAQNLLLLRQVLEKRAARERFLSDALLFHTPLPDNLFRLFNAATPENLSVSDAENAFLLRVMNEYLE